MNKKRICTIVIFILADMLITKYLFLRGVEESFWIFHIICFLIYFYIDKRYFRADLEELEILVLFLPVLGFLSLFLREIFFFKGKFEAEIEESGDLEHYIRDKQRNEEIDLALELDTLGAYDCLNVGSPEDKKRFIMGFEYPEVQFKVEVLKKALEDNDIEVIHYAATEISKIDEGFQKHLKKYQEEEDMSRLGIEYGKYCSSGLLQGEILKFYQRRGIEVLEALNDKNEDEVLELLTLYKESGEIEKCGKFLEKILTEKELSPRLREFGQRFYYEENKFKEVRRWQESV